MSTTKAEGKSQFAVVAQQLSAGTAKHLTAATPVAFMGGSFTPAQITTELQQVVTLRSDVNTAKAAVTAKVATEKTDLPSLRTFIAAYKAYLKVAFGTSPDVLADFGLAPKARSTPTTATKAAAVVKRTATRAARHTMGTVQKKAVKGDVTDVTLTPVISAPVPTVAPPAPAGPTTSGAAPVTATTHST
jgi:hypothetical protein